ncbi:MAG: signal peptide peptidase SppA [Lachnospiraceae bacterium]|nr:signal peptide peptidase SppA [Lachnospiraceae bacterium]
MNGKQVVSMLVATALFVVTGVSSVAINTWSETKKSSSQSEVAKKIFSSLESNLPSEDYIAVIDVEGTIYSEAETGFFGESEGYDHPATMRYVDKLIKDDKNKGILLYINTPGGEVTASDDLYLKLMKYKEETGRKIYCYFADQACSGGYYISMAADEIYANRNCWTGSIGVIISLTNMKGLYDKLGIQGINITSGKNKAMGSSTEELTDQQREILQSMVDEAYEQFVEIVAQGRGLEVKKVKKLADGRIYTAKQALAHKLIDGTSTYEDYLEKIKAETGDVLIYEQENINTSLSSLFSTIQQIRGRSDAEVLSDLLEKQGNGGLMYYESSLQ